MDSEPVRQLGYASDFRFRFFGLSIGAWTLNTLFDNEGGGYHNIYWLMQQLFVPSALIAAGLQGWAYFSNPVCDGTEEDYTLVCLAESFEVIKRDTRFLQAVLVSAIPIILYYLSYEDLDQRFRELYFEK